VKAAASQSGRRELLADFYDILTYMSFVFHSLGIEGKWLLQGLHQLQPLKFAFGFSHCEDDGDD
jgi:hypothetical protein